MTDQKAAYASRTFKKDKIAWAVLTLFALAIIWGTGEWVKTDRVILRSWKGPVSNQATLTVLGFDRVVLHKNNDHIYKEDLESQLKALEEDGFQAVSITDIYKFYYEGNPLPEKSVLLIFENGYLETYRVVDPILRKMKWPAAMTIITETVVKKETFFLYWNRLSRMVTSGVWSLISGGHHKRGGLIQDSFITSRDLIEANIGGYKLLAHSPAFNAAQRNIKKVNQMKSSDRPAEPFYQLGFKNSFIGVNDKNSNPLWLRQLRVKPGWEPETLLAVLNKGIQASVPSDANQKESIWFEDNGEWIETIIDQKYRPQQTARFAGTPKTERGIRIHGSPGAKIYFPAENKAENWVLEADIRLDHGEFWVVQNSPETSSGWRVGGNSKNINAQVRVANGQYENLAGSKLGIATGVWHHARLIKRGKGIMVHWNGEALWKYPVYLQYDLKGDIVLQVWAREGEASLGVSDTKISFFPDDIRWLKNYPEDNDIQYLIKNAEKISGVTTVTHVIGGSGLEPVLFDKDLLKIISNRYGWEFLPMVRVLAQVKATGNHDLKNGRKNPTGDIENFTTTPIKQLIQKNRWTHVSLDLSQLSGERKTQWLSGVEKLNKELEELNCFLFVSTEPRPNVSQSIKFELPLKENDWQASQLVSERSH